MKPKKLVLKTEKSTIRIVPASHGDLIRALLAARGIRISDIARELNVSLPTVSLVISGRNRSRRVEKTVAERLGMKYEELWPEPKKGDG